MLCDKIFVLKLNIFIRLKTNLNINLYEFLIECKNRMNLCERGRKRTHKINILSHFHMCVSRQIPFFSKLS